MKSQVRILLVSALVLTGNLLNINAQDWPQWRGTNRDGKVVGFKAPDTWPQQLTNTWKINVGLGDATPALVKDRLYVFTKIGDNEVLQCLNALTGKQAWQSDGYPAAVVAGPASTHPGPRSSPSVSDGKVVTIGVAGDVSCYDAKSGKLIWRNEQYKGAVPPFFTSMSPLIYSGVCYVHLGGPQAGQIVAFDLSTGSVKWKVEGEGPAYGSPVLLSFDGTKQIVFQSLTKLISFDLADGKELWEFATPSGTGRVQNSATPIVDQNKVYFTGLNNGVNAIEIKKEGSTYAANTLWTNPDFSTGYNTPVLKDGFLYGLSNKNRLFCINAGNGKTAWSDETVLQVFGSIVDCGSVIIVLTSNSNFVVMKPDGEKYNQVASIKLEESAIYAHPVITDNRIYIKDKESLTLFTLK